jgi:hypothetical protein
MSEMNVFVDGSTCVVEGCLPFFNREKLKCGFLATSIATSQPILVVLMLFLVETN